MTSYRHNTSGFTMIELLVGMTVFAIGLTGIFWLLSMTMSSAHFSRDEIVVSGLIREQFDLMHNLRDTNIRNFFAWDNYMTGTSTANMSSGIYIVENNFETSTLDVANKQVPITIKKIDEPFPTKIEERFEKTQLFLDDQGRYTHEVTASGTQYASYLIVSPLTVDGDEIKKNNKNQWWILDARVIVNNRGYNEYDAKTMITDWIR